MLEKIIGVEEAAKILGLAAGTVKNKCADLTKDKKEKVGVIGDLKFKKIGKQWVFIKK